MNGITELDASVLGADLSSLLANVPRSNGKHQLRPRGEAPDTKPGAATAEVTVPYLRNATATAFLFAAGKKVFGDSIRPQTVQQFIDEMKLECGATDDPVAGWLVEHAAILRFVGAYLHGATIANDRPQDQVLLNAAACQTSGEMRRLISALRDYRESSGMSRGRKPRAVAKTTTPKRKRKAVA